MAEYNKEKLRETYNQIAEAWNKTHHSDDWWIEGTDEFISLLPPSAFVLDLGCGGGNKTKYLSSKGVKVLGIDFSEGQIAVARKEVPEVRFKVMDIYDLDKLRGSFDGIFAQASLLHIPKKDTEMILRKMVSKLRKGGLIYVAVKNRDTEIEEELKISDDIGYKYERFFSYYKKEEVEQLFKKTGLEIVSSRFLDSGRFNWIQVIGRC